MSKNIPNFKKKKKPTIIPKEVHYAVLLTGRTPRAHSSSLRQWERGSFLTDLLLPVLTGTMESFASGTSSL